MTYPPQTPWTRPGAGWPPARGPVPHRAAPPGRPQPPGPHPPEPTPEPPSWPPEHPRPGHEQPRPEPPQIPRSHVTPYLDTGSSWWEERLFEQRVLLATGRLDAERATALAAKLLTLDAVGEGPITLRIDTGNAEMGAAWLLVDTLDALVTPVHALVVGEIGGGSLGLLTAVAERRSHRHARFRLADPPLSGIVGTAERVSGEFASQQRLLDAFHTRLAATTGRDPDEIAADLRRGRFLTADQAVDYGLVTAILG